MRIDDQISQILGVGLSKVDEQQLTLWSLPV